MTVQEIRNKKEKLQYEIRDKLIDFGKECGVCVTDISMITAQRQGDGLSKIITNVYIDVSL